MAFGQRKLGVRRAAIDADTDSDTDSDTDTDPDADAEGIIGQERCHAEGRGDSQ